jgi:hypothetical protein
MISASSVWSRRLFHELKRFGHPSGGHEREHQQALTLGGSVQPARRTCQVERFSRTVSGAQRSPCRLTQLPGFRRHAHDGTQIAPAARA